MLDRILDAAEQQIARADFRQSGAKADLNVKHAQPALAGFFEDVCSASDQVRLILCVNGNNGGLQVHAENRRAGSIKVCQGISPQSCLSDGSGLAMSPPKALQPQSSTRNDLHRLSAPQSNWLAKGAR
jgi:hypothetical protein